MRTDGSAERVRKRRRRERTLHETLHGLASEIDWKAAAAQLLAVVWARKLRASGHRLTARRREYLQAVAECVLRGEDPSHLTLKSRRPIELHVELADVQAVTELISEVLHKAMRSTVAKAAKEAADFVLKGALPLAKDVQAEKEAFERRLRRSWGRAFDYMRALITMSIEIGDRQLEIAQQRPRGARGEDMLLAQLHARGCVIATEVLVLLEAGHASGALARWRTLHEVDVVAAFVAVSGPATARRYRAHADAEQVKIERAADLDPDTLDLHKLLGARRARRLLRWGKAFGTDFGWAAPALGLKRPTLGDLEKKTGREGWRQSYVLACAVVHAGSYATHSPIGMAGVNGILAGPSNAELEIAAEWTVKRLLQLSFTLLDRSEDVDSAVSAEVLSSLGIKTLREVEKAQGRILGRVGPSPSGASDRAKSKAGRSDAEPSGGMTGGT